MFMFRPFRSIATPVLALALLLALAWIVPSALRPRPVSAQGVVTCPNGTVIYTGQTCPATGYQYCNGAYIAPNQYCSTSFSTCPNGQQIVVGQTCPTTTSIACPNGQVAFPGQQCLFGLGSVTYAAGWNMVAGPSGTIITGSSGPLYAFPPGSGNYQVVPAGSPLQAGAGYWAYFPTSTTSTLASAGPGSVTVQLPAGQFVMIGNPGSTTATVSDASATLLIYNPGSGNYARTTQLAPGQGAWAISLTGGQITITNTPGLPPAPPNFPPPPPSFPLPQVSTGSPGQSQGGERRGDRPRRGDGGNGGDDDGR